MGRLRRLRLTQNNLVETLEQLNQTLRTLAVSTWLIPFIFGVSLLVFFSANLPEQKWNLLGMMFVALLYSTYINARHIRRQRKEVQANIQDCLAQ